MQIVNSSKRIIRIFAFALSLCMAISIAACGGGQSGQTTAATQAATQAATEAATAAATAAAEQADQTEAAAEAATTQAATTQAAAPAATTIKDEEIVKAEDLEEVVVDDRTEYLNTYYSKAEPMISLTQNMKSGGPDVIWDPGDSIDNNNSTRWAERTMGVKWSSTWNAVNQDEDTQKLNLAMAANDLPDLIRAYTSTEVMRMAEAGQIIPLNEAIDKYVSPLGKYMLNDMNEATQGMHFKMNYYQGKLYGMGSFADMVTPQANHWRQDILTELGWSSPPNTIDEIDEVYAAFKEKYPDKICLGLDKKLKDGVNAVFLAYGAQVQSWRKTPENTLVYSPVTPQAKEALAKLAEWYSKGYLDREFIVKDDQLVESQWTAGDMLSRQREWWICWGGHINLLANVPEAVIATGDYWVGPGGEWGSMQIKPNEFEQYCISSNVSEAGVKAIMTGFNFHCDSAFRSHEDLQEKFIHYYAYEPEVPCYNIDEVSASRARGDKQVPREKYDITPEREGPSSGQSSWWAVAVNQGEQFGIRFNQRPNMLRNDFLKIEKALAENDQNFLDNFVIYIQLKDSWSRNSLDSLFQNIHYAEKSEAEGHTYFDMQWCPATPTQLQKNAYLEKLELTAIADIIMGQRPVSYFDEFVDEWNRNGGTEITKEINDWWDSVK